MGVRKQRLQLLLELTEDAITEAKALLELDLHQVTGWSKSYKWIAEEFARMSASSKPDNFKIVRRHEDPEELAIWRDGDYPRHPDHSVSRENDKRRKSIESMRRRIDG